MDVFKTLPVFEGKRFILRGVQKSDAADLLKVYSDERAVPLFNGDNCHGDDFHYTTIERMNEAIGFWLFSYDNGYFVRWAIIDKTTNAAVGTIELFHRDSADAFDNCGLLRLDLFGDCERRDDIVEILSLLIPDAFDLFYCDKIATKIKPSATERRTAALSLGYKPSAEALIGNEGEPYYDYYVLNKAQ